MNSRLKKGRVAHVNATRAKVQFARLLDQSNRINPFVRGQKRKKRTDRQGEVSAGTSPRARVRGRSPVRASERRASEGAHSVSASPVSLMQSKPKRKAVRNKSAPVSPDGGATVTAAPPEGRESSGSTPKRSRKRSIRRTAEDASPPSGMLICAAEDCFRGASSYPSAHGKKGAYCCSNCRDRSERPLSSGECSHHSYWCSGEVTPFTRAEDGGSEGGPGG